MKATHICSLPQCAQRLLCEGCFSDAHASKHFHSIASVADFLAAQNRRRTDIAATIDRRCGEVEAFLSVFEAELKQSRKAIDGDLAQIYQRFVEVLNGTNAFLKEQTYKDYTELSTQFQALRRQATAAQSAAAQSDAADFVLTLGREPLESAVERLAAKNGELNLLEAEVGGFFAHARRAADNRIVYKINRQSQELVETLQEVFLDLCIRFFRNFRMLLVRPTLEHAFLSQFEKLKAKLLRERDAFRSNERERRDSASLTNVSFTDLRQMLVAPHDAAVVEPRALVLPEVVTRALGRLVEFKPQGVRHPTFEKLGTRPAVLLEDGAVYEGQWEPQSGARHGFGRALFPDGSYYQGYWLYGKPSIVGRLVYPNGDVFEGILARGRPNGRGVLLCLNGDKYEGNFCDGQRHGAGVEETADGCNFRGEFVRNQRHGPGVLRRHNGAMYSGEFFEGQPNGKGRSVGTNGEEYDGEWFEGKKHGFGTFRYQDGRVYEGDFVEDCPHGYGTLTLSNGAVVKAFWNRGEPAGLGLKTERDARASLIFDQSDPSRDADLSLIG